MIQQFTSIDSYTAADILVQATSKIHQVGVQHSDVYTIQHESYGHCTLIISDAGDSILVKHVS